MKILIATDGSEYSQSALESIAERPWPVDTSFVVLHVVQTLAPAYIGFNYGYAEALATVDEAGRKEGRKILDAAIDFLKQRLPNCNITNVLSDGYVLDGILDAAEKFETDLIVVGSHGRTGLVKFFLGSVAEAVLNRAPCSVEVVRKPATKQPLKPESKSQGSLEAEKEAEKLKAGQNG